MTDTSQLIDTTVTQALRDSRLPAAQQHQDVLAALRRLPGLRVDELHASQPWSLLFRDCELWLGCERSTESHRRALQAVAPLGLHSAPEIAGELAAGEGYRLLILRYPACPGEDLLTYEEAEVPISEASERALLADFRTLDEHGLVHYYSRGPFYWRISSRTGTVVLTEWECVRSASLTENASLAQRIPFSVLRQREKLLGRHRATIGDPSRNAAPTAAPDVPTLRSIYRGDEADAPALPHAAASLERDRARATLERAPRRNRLREVFGERRVLLPVIHPIDWQPALTAVQLALGAGVPGVFLINQGMSAEEVLELARELHRRHPALWVGVNLLGYSPVQALETALDACGRLDGLWTDDAGIDERLAISQQLAGRELLEARQRLAWDGVYFGGVAFKYRRQVPHESLSAAATTAAPFVDVLCTSGAGTGVAASPDKLAALASAAPELPLALASGVTCDNVGQYLPYARAFLVGTGIEHSLGVLDPVRLATLQRAISGWPVAA